MKIKFLFLLIVIFFVSVFFSQLTHVYHPIYNEICTYSPSENELGGVLSVVYLDGYDPDFLDLLVAKGSIFDLCYYDPHNKQKMSCQMMVQLWESGLHNACTCSSYAKSWAGYCQ